MIFTSYHINNKPLERRVFLRRNTVAIFGMLAGLSCFHSYSQTVYADSWDDFAAELLCGDGANCASSQSTDPRTSLIIEGTVLPDDAARDVDEEQAFFIQQGAYLNQAGTLVSLEGSAVVVTLPERGQLKTGSGTEVITAPLSAPVIITIPSEKRE